MAAIFLSYSHQDQKQVAALAAALQQHGHTVWWDRHIRGGAEYARAIEKALAEAEVVVPVWTARSVASHWVRDEAATARDDGRIVPVRLEAIDPPLGFRQFQTVDLSEWNGRPNSPSLEPLLAAVAATGSAPAEGAPNTVAPMARAPFPARAGFVGLAAVVAGAAAIQIFWGSVSGAESARPRVRLAEINATSGGLPTGIAESLRQEALSAFSVENAVTVIAGGYGAGQSKGDYALTGNIRRSGDQVLFGINLKNERTGAVVWARTFDRPVPTAAAAPHEVALAASQIVRCGLGGVSYHGKPLSDDALTAYLRYCDEFWAGTGAADELLQTSRAATAAAPAFSFAWSARALSALALAEDNGMDAPELRREAAISGEKALQLNGRNPEGYLVRAKLLPVTAFAEREALLKKAIAALPLECGCERQAYGDFLAATGRVEDALDQYQRAQSMQPLAPFSNRRLAHGLYQVGQREEANKVLGTIEPLWPDAVELRLLRVRADLWNGDFAAAAAKLKSIGSGIDEVKRNALVEALEAKAAGDTPRLEVAARELERLSNDQRRNDSLTVATLAAIGRSEAALDGAARLMRKNGFDEAAVLFEPVMAEARAAPRFEQLARSTGLLGYWKATRRAPDFCLGPGAPRVCKLV